MILCGNTFLGYKNTDNMIPTNIVDCNITTVSNCIIKELFATRNMNTTISDTISTVWDKDTILHGLYAGSINIGNVDFYVENTTDLLIKRRIKGTLKWDVLFHKSINGDENRFNQIVMDKFNQSGVSYEYALVPVNNGVEGNYVKTEVYSCFDSMYLVETDSIFSVLLDLKNDRQRNKPSATIAPLNREMPVYISNSKTRYDSGSASAIMVEQVNGDFDQINAWNYRHEFLNFLTDGKAKIMKTFDGKIYIIQIIGEPVETQGDHWNAPTTSFNWVQVGKITNKDLYENGLLDIGEEWWMI